MFKTAMGGTPGAAPITSASGAMAGPGGWHPTVLYLAGLVVAEILLVGFAMRFVRS